MTTLIVGASQAGLQLAASLRELGDTSPIVMVGEEEAPPYQRPPLSKAYLTGHGKFAERALEHLEFRNEGWFTTNDVTLVLGERVVAIDRDGAGGTATTSTGRELRFDRLALTTGAVCRTLPIPGADLAGVFALRTERDSRELSAAIGFDGGPTRNVVVIGGGFIGLEVAASARAAGHTVTVLEAADRLVGRVVSPETSAFYLAAHRRRGTRVLLDAVVEAIEGGDGRVTGVRADGELIPADVVLIGVGVAPRVELAEALGLAVRVGIVVDERSWCSDGVTVAAGDCTVQPNPYPLNTHLQGAGGLVRVESVQNAVDQAKAAAATLLGREPGARPVPWFWSDQDDLKLQIAGLCQGYDQTVVRGDPDAEKFTVLYYLDGALIAADSVNAPLDHIAVKSALGRGAQLPPEVAADLSLPLKKLIVEPVAAPARGPLP